MSKYENQKILEQIINYYYKGYIDSKLYEAGLFIFKNKEKMNNFFNDWWQEILKYSYQDQISLPFVLWKNNINPKILNEKEFIKGNISKIGSVWNNKLFGIVRDHK